MRLPEDKIKRGILHPEAEIRLTAASYFADSHGSDPEVMPILIEAVEKYGRDSSFRLLRDAEHLVQTTATLDWLINEVSRDFEVDDIATDNLRFAIGLVVVAAPLGLLAKRKLDIDRLAGFPVELRGPLDERLEMANWEWERCWEAFEGLGRRTMRAGDVTINENRYASRIIGALARFSQQREEQVLRLLQRKCPPNRKRLMQWLEPEIIKLAGQMRLESAIPILIRRLHSEEDSLIDAAEAALMNIGTDAVVEAIAIDWWDASDDFRGAAADILEKIHTDRCVEECLDFIDLEDDLETAIALGHALLSHFAFEAIEPVLEFLVIEQDDWTVEHVDLLYHLLASATIMEATFPEYERWYRQAQENNWGWEDYERPRLAEAFRPDPVGPVASGNGKG